MVEDMEGTAGRTGNGSDRCRKRVRTIAYLVALVAGLAVVAVAVPRLIEMRMASSECSVVHDLRTYVEAQKTFRAADHYGKGKHVYANPIDGTGFPDLYEIGGPRSGGKVLNLIDRDFTEATSPERAWRGYWFVDITGDRDGHYDYAKQFGLCAVPAEHERTGFNTFIVDVSGEVYQKNTKGEPVTIWPDVDGEGWIPLGSR